MVVKFFLSGFVSDNGGGQISFILSEIMLTHILYVDLLLASLSFSLTFVLIPSALCSQVFLGPGFLVYFIRKFCTFVRMLSVPFANTCPCQLMLLAFASRSIVSSKSNICIRSFFIFLSSSFTPYIALSSFQNPYLILV